MSDSKSAGSPPLATGTVLIKESPAQRPYPHLHLVGYRGYIALAVIFIHTMDGLRAWYPATFSRLYAGPRLRCHRGILLFFILSSFQLTLGLLERVPAQHRGWRPFFKQWTDYTIRRLFRIYPPFIAILLVLKFFPTLGVGHFGGNPTGPKDMWKLLTLREKGGALGMLWTLPPELEYYLVIPLLVTVYKKAEAADWQGRQKRLGLGKGTRTPPWRIDQHLLSRAFQIGAVFLFALPAFVLPSFYPLANALSAPFDHPHLPNYYSVFYAGSVAAIILYKMNQTAPATSSKQPANEHKQPDAKQGHAPKILSRIPIHLLWKGAVFGPVWATWCIQSDFQHLVSRLDENLNVVRVFPNLSHFKYVGCCLATVFLSSAWPLQFPGSFNWVMTSRPLLQAGMMSYSIYLCHPMAIKIVHLQLANDWHPQTYPLLGCIYALALLFGLLGRYLVETPFIKLGSSLSRRLSALIDPVRRGTPLLVMS